MSRELKIQRAALISQARAMIDGAETEGRDLTAEEQAGYDGLIGQIDQLAGRIARDDRLSALETEMEKPEPRRAVNEPVNVNLKTGRGDNELKATAWYIRTGDVGALRGLDRQAASNDTDMNIGTVADGGYAVPTGHYQGIIAKRDTVMLADALGCTRIPGQGTTVNVPVDNGTANVFVSTNEAANFDRDAPVLGQAAMTLVKYTKKIQLSVELLRDEDSRLMDFLNDYVGRAMGLTHNSLLVTEAVANGTTVALGAAAAATAGDIQTVVYSLKSEYADNAAWLMKRATEGAYRKLAGSDWQYAPAFSNGLNIVGRGGVGTLWNFPVYNSESVAAIGAGLKSIVFGNFAFVGLREASGFTFLRDPYGAANSGQINLYYYFDAVYKVLVAEAIRYGTHPTA